jgi:hypothetical protein
VRTLSLVLVLALVLVLDRGAHADPSGTDAVALLPLDADQRLEIYGQPVASEVARALVAGGIDVVVVGPKMAVPERARLVLSGMISAGKGDAVELVIRIRDRTTGSVLDKLEATAPALTNIDRAAAELSARVLPAVRARLVKAPELPAGHDDKTPVVAPARPAKTRIVAAIAAAPVTVPASPVVELHDGFAPALAAWAEHHHRQLDATAAFASLSTAKTAAAGDAELAIAIEPLAYELVEGTVPMARARVHVRIADAKHVAFDRIVETDTVVGERTMTADQLAARVAREVLWILEPHLRRAIGSWR